MHRRAYLGLVSGAVTAGCAGKLSKQESQTEIPDTAPASKNTAGLNEWTGGVGADRAVSIQGVEVRAKEYTLREVGFYGRPQWMVYPYQPHECPYNSEEIQDWPTLYTKEVQGQTSHHPLRTTRVMGIYLNGYRETADEGFKTKVEEMSEALLAEQTTESDGAYYFNYGFDFDSLTDYIHEAPWFCCMSQGTGLSTYLRFYELTGDERYRTVADKIWQSYLNIRTTYEKPWITYKDQHGYLWLEEYPEPDPTNVLNGFIIGLWGPYEYWLVTGSEKAKELVQAALTTLEQYTSYYRNEGGNSWYSLLRKKPVEDHYHRLHIFQLAKLANIAREPYFEELSHQLYSDNSLGHQHCKTLQCDGAFD